MSAQYDSTQQLDAIPEQEKAFVMLWERRVLAAKKYFQKDFDRMKRNMEVAGGIQWEGQEEMTDPRYTNNVILRAVNQKVAQLYARNPKAEVLRIDRMDFEVWDGEQESIESAVQQAMLYQSQGLPPPPDVMALLNDYETGMQFRKIVDKVAETLVKVYDWQIAQQQPTFKAMMKSLVRRVTTCGVGYLRPNFVREGEAAVDSNMGIGSERHMMDQLLEMEAEMGEGDEKAKANTEAKYALAASLKQSQESQVEDMVFSEMVVLDTLDSLSVIPDTDCVSIKNFDKAKWVAIEYRLPIEDIETFFKKELCGNAEVKQYTTDGEEWKPSVNGNQDEAEDKCGCVWEVINKSAKSRFFICEGYKGFLQAPEPVIKLARFWPLLSLTFNDLEVIPGLKVTCMPPSDVDLLLHAQKERNRQREDLRGHRKANTPGQVIPAGVLQDGDKDLITERDPHDIIELKVPVGTDMSKLIQPLPQVEINPVLYDTSAVDTDMQYSTGMQEANFGPAKPNVTATVGAISEQSRQTGIGSNIDDVDDFLGDAAKVVVELSVRYMTEDVVKAIAGRGAVFPSTDRDVFLNSIAVNVAAASSGRPNQALDVQNYERLVPLLLQAGVNPKFVVREGVRRLGDRLNLQDAFPLLPPSPTPLPSAKPTGAVPPMATTAAG